VVLGVEGLLLILSNQKAVVDVDGLIQLEEIIAELYRKEKTSTSILCRSLSSVPSSVTGEMPALRMCVSKVCSRTSRGIKSPSNEFSTLVA
jgi:hypothetical protein